MKIRTRINTNPSRQESRSIRTRSNNPYLNRSQKIMPAPSRYNNESGRNSNQNLNVSPFQQENYLEDDNFLQDESLLEDESHLEEERFFRDESHLEEERFFRDESFLEEESLLDEESLLEEDEISFENFQSKLIEERNTHEFYSGEYGPYFPNATTFMLFTWCTKHMISKYLHL